MEFSKQRTGERLFWTEIACASHSNKEIMAHPWEGWQFTEYLTEDSPTLSPLSRLLSLLLISPDLKGTVSSSLPIAIQKSRERICALCLLVFRLGHWSSPVFRLWLKFTPSAVCHGSQTLGRGLEPWDHRLPWVSSVLTVALGNSQPPQPCKPIFYHTNAHTRVCVCPLVPVFLKDPD